MSSDGAVSRLGAVPVCAACGYEAAEAVKFCPECGAAVASSGHEQRKVVTVLFCDVVGSTALGESVDPEALRTLLARYFARMKAVVERHGGVVEKFIGDAVMAVFGLPAVHEDDALRGLRAALEMQLALAELGIEGRIGVNTGEVVTGTAERLATGDAVNVAARLEQAAGPGEILLGASTLRLARDAIDAEPVDPLPEGEAGAGAGLAAPVRPQRDARAIVRLPARRAPSLSCRRSLTPSRASRRRRAASWSPCVGPAGVGKSRLTAELLARIDATVVRGRCPSYGEGITYWPVVEVLKQLESRRPELELDDAAARGARHAARRRGRLFDRRDRLGISQAARGGRRPGPLVAIFDDIQWGEEAFLDLVEHLAFVSTGVPILLAVHGPARAARPARRLGRSGPARAARHRGGAAAAGDAARREAAPPAARERILAAAGGNPLFVEEMAAMLHESGGGEVVVPPTLQALLAARLDQLDPAERTILEYGAVEGEIFHRSAVQALTPPSTRLTTRLTALVRRELIRPDKTQVAGDDAFRFRHLLIRDAAYDATPKAKRADLHERLTGWLEERGAGLVELDELLGHHLEQAYRYRAELGPSTITHACSPGGRPSASEPRRAGRTCARTPRRP